MFRARRFSRRQMPAGEAVLGGRLEYMRCREWLPGGHARKSCINRPAFGETFEYLPKREEAAGL